MTSRALKSHRQLRLALFRGHRSMLLSLREIISGNSILSCSKSPLAHSRVFEKFPIVLNLHVFQPRGILVKLSTFKIKIVGPSLERMDHWAYTLNVKLYYPYRQSTNLFIFRNKILYNHVNIIILIKTTELSKQSNSY